MKIIDGHELAAIIKKAADQKRDSGLYILAGLVTGFVNDMPEAEAYNEAKKRIENMEKVNEDLEERIAIMSEGGWHDAEKDSPKETDCYIVRIDYGIGQMTTMRQYVSSEGKWLMSIEEKITHWMPMPKPPKGVDHNG